MHDQQNFFSASEVRKQLIEKNEVLDLTFWDVTFKKCTRTECTAVDRIKNVGFPYRNLPENIVKLSHSLSDSNLAKNEKLEVITAEITHTLSDDEREWIKTLPRKVSVVIPTPVQNYVKGYFKDGFEQSEGMGTPSQFSFSKSELLESGIIRLEFEFTGYSWFGPTDLPIVLSSPDSVSMYQSLYTRQQASGGFGYQLSFGISVILAVMALVLDHSLSFAFLSLFAVARATRSFIGALIETSGTAFDGTIFAIQTENAYVIAKGAMGLVSGLCLAFLIFFTLELMFLRPKKKMSYVYVTVASVAIFTGMGIFQSDDFWTRADLYNELATSSICFLIVLVGVTNKYLFERTPEFKRKQTTEEAFTTLNRTLFYFRAAALALAFGLNASTKIQEMDYYLKSVLDIKYIIFLPGLVLVSLLEVGSVTRKIRSVGRAMADKAIVDQELKVGRQIQARMLPPKRGTTKNAAWRASYYPASALAGDWFDVREIEFKDNKKYLIACVADVTGHGVGASLTTSVISAFWGEWCQERASKASPSDGGESRKLIEDALSRLDTGLLSLRKNERATVAVVFIDHENKELSYCCAGHPGIIVGNGKAFKYLFTTGNPAGTQSGDIRVGLAKSEPLSEMDTVCLYSDGIVPLNKTVSGWCASLKRKFGKGEDIKIEKLLHAQLIANKRAYAKNHEGIDDMTIIYLKMLPVVNEHKVLAAS